MALGSWPTVTDDDGSFAVGTVFNKAYSDALKASIEASVFSTTNPSLSPADIIDEVVTARGSKSSLDGRMSVALNADGTLKEQSGLATKAEIQDSLGWGNWVMNDTFLIWAKGDAVAPTAWTLDTVACAKEATEVKVGPFSVKLTHSGTDGFLSQNIMGTSSFSNAGDYFKGRTFTFGCWVKTSVASMARIQLDDGNTTSETSYHTGGGGWEFLSTTHEVSALATRLTIKLECKNSSGDAYFSGPTVLPGSLAMTGWTACPTIYGTIVWKKVGTVVTDTILDVFVPQRPMLVKDVQLFAGTAPVGADLIVDINAYDGSSWTSMFTTKPQIDDGDVGGEEQPDGTYAYRCLEGVSGDSFDDNAISWDVDQVGSGTAGSDLVCMVRCLTYKRPQEPLLDFNDNGV